MKKLIILLILFQSITSVFSQNLSDLSFGTEETFELVTWNIEWFPKNGQITIDSVSIILESLNADVYAIQEVDDTTNFKQMVDELDGYEYFFKSSYFAGLAYIYKSEKVVINNIYEIYTSQPYWSPFPRSPVVMEITYNDKEIIIINNHFKCCGNGILNLNDSGDEETRRLYASNLLKEYIDTNFTDKRVLMTGDLNDVLTDSEANNVFQSYLDDPLNYRFADMDIALGPNSGWSYPSWPSHLDHILMTNEVFGEFMEVGSEIKVIKVDESISGGWSAYDTNISDHRPVGLKLKIAPSSIVNLEKERLSVYPNPSISNCTVGFLPSNSDSHLSIYNSTGVIIEKIIIKAGSTSYKINSEILPAGIYYLSLSIGNGLNKVEKLIITN